MKLMQLGKLKLRKIYTQLETERKRESDRATETDREKDGDREEKEDKN